MKIFEQNPVLCVTQQAYRPFPIAKNINTTPRASVAGFWKQIKRIPADKEKIKELQIIKCTMNLGHTLTAFCQKTAKVMLRKAAASTCGRKFFNIFISSLFVLPSCNNPCTPLNIRKPKSPNTRTICTRNKNKDILFVYDHEFSDINDCCPK